MKSWSTHLTQKTIYRITRLVVAIDFHKKENTMEVKCHQLATIFG